MKKKKEEIKSGRKNSLRKPSSFSSKIFNNKKKIKKTV
jgi:hypothetical protein